MTLSKIKLTPQRGFTLIEIMIALTIMSILIAIAIPNYQQHIAKTHRADAQLNLLQAASFMERFYTENNRYDQNTAAVAVALPVIINSTWYTIIIANVTQTTFNITAAPAGAQVGDICGTYSIRETGARAATGEVFVGGNPTLLCWPN